VKAATQLRAAKEREHELKRDGGAESDMTLAEAVPMYLQHLLLHQGKNYKKKEQHFREHILPKLGHLKLKNLRTHAVDQFRVHLRTEKELSHSTVNRTISTLNHLYRHAGEQEWLKVKPFKIQKYTENYQGRDRIWPDEKQAMLSTARQEGQHLMLYLFVMIGFGTGMRHREILMMQWQRINWKNCTMHLREAKTGPRHQPLPTTVLAELRSLYDSLENKQGFVFSAKTKTGHINDMSRQFKKLCKDAGLQNVYTPHYMRHTRVTELVEAGFPDNVIKEITGHKTNVMIAHYSHLRGSTAVRTAVDHCDLQAA
jgi:integrase